MIPNLGTVLQYWQSQRPRTLQVKPGPSDLGGCERRFKYKLLGYEHTNVASSTQSAMGTAIHEKLAEAATEINDIKQLGWLIEHPVEFMGLGGTMDLYGDETVLDWKTTGSRAFESVGIHGPYLSHRWQVHWYGAGAMNAGLKVSKVRINYVNRDDGRERIWEAPYDTRVLRDAVVWYKKIEEAELDACPRKYAPTSIFCQNCPMFDDCWQGAVPQRDLRSVEYAGDHAELIEELYETRQDIKVLKDREATIKGVLDAVRPDDLSVVVEGAEHAVQWRYRGRADGSESYSLNFVPKGD